MAEASEASGQAGPVESKIKDARFQSTVVFPYGDLNEGISVVKVIHEKAGGVSCSPDQLAAAMGQSPSSGNFRLKLSTARIFGLVATSPGRIEITDLGFEITDPGREKAARVQAFLNVELFKRVYEDFKGKQLPPRPAAFELMIERLGVSPKQKDKARVALDKSALQAGFYEHGKERLVMPNVGGVSESPPPRPADPPERHDPDGRKPPSRKGSGDGDGSDLHPFIVGLLDTLPPPNTNWRHEGRAKWLQTAANIFDLIYKGDGEITVRATAGKEDAA